jgi:hypothetical protein
MDEYLRKNREMWNDWAPLHAQSEFYDVEGFKKACTRLIPFHSRLLKAKDYDVLSLGDVLSLRK